MFGEYDDYRDDVPDIGRENHEACREEERQIDEDRYTVAEAKELEEEQRSEKGIDHANDMKI